MADISTDNLILVSALGCCFGALYTEVPACIGCSGKQECLCIEEEFCLKLGTTPIAAGLKTGDGYICKLGLFCCSCGLKTPSVLCKGKSQCLCLVSQGAFPTTDDIPCMCAYLGLACYPNFGCCKPVSAIAKK